MISSFAEDCSFILLLSLLLSYILFNLFKVKGQLSYFITADFKQKLKYSTLFLIISFLKYIIGVILKGKLMYSKNLLYDNLLGSIVLFTYS
jgi:hypothetical protein